MTTNAVSQDVCEKRVTAIHAKIDSVTEKVNRIVGGVIVIAALIGMFIGGVFYHINYRFSNVEKTLEKIEIKMEAKAKP